MKLRIVTVSNRSPQWIQQGYDEYARRMPRGFALDLIEVKPEVRPASTGDKDIARIKKAEAARIREQLAGFDTVVALDERGKGFTTQALAERMVDWQRDGHNAAFVIGGADGLDDAFKREASLLMSLSPMTLPHQFVRVMLAEQFYRASAILNHHPYHRA